MGTHVIRVMLWCHITYDVTWLWHTCLYLERYPGPALSVPRVAAHALDSVAM